MVDIANTVSPYRRGASNGIAMGILLSASCWALSQAIYPQAHHSAIITLAGSGLALLVPVVLFLLLLRTWIADGRRTPLVSLWAEGIMTFVYGSVIAIAAGYIYMRYINPGYVDDCFAWFIESVNAAAAAAPAAEAENLHNIAVNFRLMIDRGEAPGALEMLINSAWLIIFSGSVLSLILAAGFRFSQRFNNTPNSLGNGR